MKYKAYSFDLDDNLLTLPTKVILGTLDGGTKEFSTHEYERIKPDMKKLGYKLIDSSFEKFSADSQFLEDIIHAKKAGSWQNLVNCIAHHASIFAIITARGHSPEIIRQGLRKVILESFTEDQLEEFSKKFQTKYKIQANSPEEALDKHLDLCKFYPLDNTKMKSLLGSKEMVEMKHLGPDEMAELKYLAFKDFQTYINKYVKEKFGEDTEITIGFSDDSIVNLKRMMNEILNSHGLFLYQTTENGKNHMAFS